MAKLLLKAGVGPQSIELDDQPMTIGRRPGNRVVLDDNFASARHATISPLGRRYVLEDHHSSNGTFVNNARIAQPRALQDGDIVRIGKATYELVAREPEGAPAAPGRRPPPPPPAVPEPADSWRFEATQILSAELLPMGPTAREAPPKAPVEFEVRLPDVPKATEASQNVDLVKLAADNPEMLDALVGSLRSQRDEALRAHDEKRVQLLDQWCKVVAYAERLKAKVAVDARVKYFQISGRTNDITIRVQRSPKARIELLYFSLAHPDRDERAPTGIWFRRTGAADVCFPTAEVANRELVRHLAFVFAAS